jgi:hypothetical protein
MGPLDTRTVSLDHRAYYLRGAPQQGVLAAVSADGHVTLIREASISRLRLRHVSEIANLSLHPSRALLAYADKVSGELIVATLDGEVVHSRKPEPYREQKSYSQGSGFAACSFAADGDYLWCAQPQDAGSVRIEAYNVTDWSRVSSITVEDPFGESFCSFHRIPETSTVALYLAAGQDGQQTFWIKHHGSILESIKVPQLRDSTLAAFSLRGDEFLVVDLEHSIRKFHFPTVNEGPLPTTMGRQPPVRLLTMLSG